MKNFLFILVTMLSQSIVTQPSALDPRDAQKGYPETTQKLKSKVQFPSVTIGKQVWMKENLDADRFRNGDRILQAKTDNEWKKAVEMKQPAWCWYRNDATNGAKYGKLYNWYAVNDPRGLAPEGWHVSTWQDWVILYEYLGKGDNVGEKLKSVSGWKKYKDENEEIIGNGTDIYGFSAFPGGYREMDRDSGVSFFGIGTSCFWWTSTKDTSDSAYVQGLYNEHKFLYNSKSNLNKGLYVRCVKD